MSTLSFLLPVLLGAAEPTTAAGVHVEARTASVFAGACHYGGESVTAGREAVLALAFDGGAHLGVDLAGASVAALLVSNANLMEVNHPASAQVWVHAPQGDLQREAVLSYLRVHLGARTLMVESLSAAPQTLFVTTEREDQVRVHVDGILSLSGIPMPDRACCKMPQQVWYKPLGSVPAPLVLLCDEFRVTHPAARFARHDENNGFVGRFGS